MYADGVGADGSRTGAASPTAVRAIAASDMVSSPGIPMPLMRPTAPTRVFGSKATSERKPNRLPPCWIQMTSSLRTPYQPSPNAAVHASSER